MMQVTVVFRILRMLWKTGLLRLRPQFWRQIGSAWRNCRGSFSFLAEVAAARFPHRLAIVDDEGEMNFGALRKSYEKLAYHLRADYEIGPGKKVAVVAHNQRAFVIALLAGARTGADMLILNPRSPAAVLSKLLTPPVDLILHGADLDMHSLAAACPTLALRKEILHADGTQAGFAPKLMPIPRAGKLVVLTAGSTGISKRVGRRPRLSNLLPAVLHFFEAFPIALHRPTVLAVPLFHGHGLTTLAMTLTCAAPLYIGHRMDIPTLLARVPSGALRPIVVAVPTLLRRWLSASTKSAEVSAVVTGSAPLGPCLCRRLIETNGPILFNVYGSTETGIISLATPEDLVRSPGTAGRPLHGNSLQIVDETGTDMQTGEIGRIRVRGPLVLHRNSSVWHDTGDVGRFDAFGCLHVCGRSDSMFISGGENVYPEAVEDCLRENLHIEDAAVIVVPDDDFGQRMKAYVVLKHPLSAGPEALKHWMSLRLERHQLPATIEIVSSLPRNALGKLDRPTLLDERDKRAS